MRLRTWFALGLLVSGILMGALPMAVGAGVAGPQWFGPTEIDSGWHMRVPVTVRNEYAVPLRNAPVAAELDLGVALMDAGWPGFEGTGTRVITGFQLDLASIRVIQVSSLGAFTGTGSAEGRILGEIPSLAMPGLLGASSPASDVARPFNPATNPVVTVYFRVPGDLAAGQSAFFEVYFDSTSNGPKQPPVYDGIDHGNLESLHWSTAGVRLYGRIVVPPRTANAVMLIGLHDDTEVTVSTLRQGQFTTEGVTIDGGNPVTLSAGQVRLAGLGVGDKPVVRIDATAPVVAAVDPVGFVPAVDGALGGSRFVFRTGPSADATGVYLVNPGTSEASVRITGTGFSRTFTVPGGFYAGSDLSCAGEASLQPSTTYTAVVESGGPILVQLQPRIPQQAPALDGAPAGTRFLAAAQWSDPDNCGVGRGQPARAQALASGVGLQVFSLEDSRRIFPAGSAATGPILPVPGSTEVPLQVSEPRARDRPLAFDATGPMRLFVGGTHSNGISQPVGGPLGGSSAGREFASQGPALVIAPYAETHVVADVQYVEGSRRLEHLLGREGTLVIDEDNDLGRVLGATIVSDRPILVQPLDATTGFLAGVPGFLKATGGAAQYRGRLLELTSPTGQDPVTATAKAGEVLSIPLLVANRGTGVDGGPGPTEAVQITVAGAPAGWSASVDRPDLSLGPDAEETVRLLVTPPTGTTSGGPPAALKLVASSRDRPSVRDALDVVVFVKNSFGVGVWFLEPGLGPKSHPMTVAPGGTASYPVFVKNLGSQRDTVLIETSTGGDRDVAMVVDGKGQPIDAVALDPGAIAALVLRVPSGTLVEGLLVTTLTARSQTASSALDRVTALTRVRMASDLNVTALDPVLHVADGQESRFRILLANEGQGMADVRLQLLSDAPGSWTPPRLFLLDPIDGKRIPLDRLTLDGQSSQTVYANLTVPAGWPAGRLVALRLLATPEGSSTVDASLLGLVAARHRIDVRPENDPVPTVPGTATLVRLDVRNLGNLAEQFTLQPGDLPAGWRMQVPSSLDVPRNTTSVVQVEVMPAAGAVAGLHKAVLRLTAFDGSVINSTLNFTMPATLGTSSGRDLAIEAQPGRPVRIEMPYGNTGNLRLLARLVTAAGEAWSLESDPPVTIAPGANTTVYGTFHVPRGQPDGATTHNALLRLEAVDGSLAMDVPFSVDIDVGRADIQLAEGQVASGPAGALVHALVRNAGVRPATDVRIVLRDADGEALAESRVARIAPGAAAQILLASPSGVPAGARLLADPDDEVVEAVESDNALPLSPGRQQATPLSGLSVALALALAVWGRRRAASHPTKA